MFSIGQKCILGTLCLLLSQLPGWAQEDRQTGPDETSSTGSATPDPISASADEVPAAECASLKAALDETSATLVIRKPLIEQQLKTLESELKTLEQEAGQLPATELTQRRQTLTTHRNALQDELKHLAEAQTSWQAALDACIRRHRLRDELTRISDGAGQQSGKVVEGDIEVLRRQLVQVQSERQVLGSGEEERRQRLETLSELPLDSEEFLRRALEAERDRLHARQASVEQQREMFNVEEALLQTRLEHASKAVGTALAPSIPATATAPASDTQRQDAEVEAIQRQARETEANARDQLGYYRRRVEQIEKRLAEARQADRPALQLELELTYFARLVAYEQGRLKQAELQKRSALELRSVAQLDEQLRAVRAEVEQLRARRGDLTPAEREEQAERYRQLAEEARAQARELMQRTEIEAEAIPPVQQMLPTLDAVEAALDERLAQVETLAEQEIISAHLLRMQRQLNVERQQINLHIMTLRTVIFAIIRQGTLHEKLASAYQEAAEVLVPPVPPFFERHRKIFTAIGILLGIFATTTLIKVVVWLVRTIARYVNQQVADGHISVKRVSTLVGFTSSIARLFVWIFGLIWILEVFGISPAATSGALGLIGLILAGMFQQIVIDFVKGVDIIAGQHYNVGDFVEVDGKMGHVIDLNVKHTRLRTMSGQEFNIPNSRCVPSRCFPDGFVNNYVDVTLADARQFGKARTVISELSANLNQRLEPIRSEPELMRRFDGPGSRATMRYRLSLLPGAEWVIKDYFIPEIRKAMEVLGIELAGEPTYFFINRIETFRKLFSRRLSEEEIVREVKHVAPELPETPKS